MVAGTGNIGDGKSSGQIIEAKGNNATRVGAHAGDDTQLRPTIVYDRPYLDPQRGFPHVGRDFYVMKGRQFDVYRWDGTHVAKVAYDPDAYAYEQWVGPTLLFALHSYPWYRVKRWTEQDGVRDLVGSGEGYYRGATSPGSDGKDLVWLEGDGLVDTMRFPNRWIATSKYSTDPAEILPRRLGRWSSQYLSTAGSPPAVGCGLAAFVDSATVGGSLEENAVVLLIVRLSDGNSWTLPSASLSAPLDAWGTPLAITCEEVFAAYIGAGPRYQTIRRVRLDSLGPGEPLPQ